MTPNAATSSRPGRRDPCAPCRRAASQAGDGNPGDWHYAGLLDALLPDLDSALPSNRRSVIRGAASRPSAARCGRGRDHVRGTWGSSRSNLERSSSAAARNNAFSSSTVRGWWTAATSWGLGFLVRTSANGLCFTSSRRTASLKSWKRVWPLEVPVACDSTPVRIARVEPLSARWASAAPNRVRHVVGGGLVADGAPGAGRGPLR